MQAIVIPIMTTAIGTVIATGVTLSTIYFFKRFKIQIVPREPPDS